MPKPTFASSGETNASGEPGTADLQRGENVRHRVVAARAEIVDAVREGRRVEQRIDGAGDLAGGGHVARHPIIMHADLLACAGGVHQAVDAAHRLARAGRAFQRAEERGGPDGDDIHAEAMHRVRHQPLDRLLGDGVGGRIAPRGVFGERRSIVGGVDGGGTEDDGAPDAERAGEIECIRRAEDIDGDRLPHPGRFHRRVRRDCRRVDDMGNRCPSVVCGERVVIGDIGLAPRHARRPRRVSREEGADGLVRRATIHGNDRAPRRRFPDEMRAEESGRARYQCRQIHWLISCTVLHDSFIYQNIQ